MAGAFLRLLLLFVVERIPESVAAGNLCFGRLVEKLKDDLELLFAQLHRMANDLLSELSHAY